MELNHSQILDIIHRRIRPAEIKRSVIYWYKKTLQQGEAFKIGPQVTAMPFEGMLVFVDLAPQTNWAHPCRIVLVDSSTLETQVIDASLPPNIDQFDEDYVILLRYGEKPSHERSSSE